LFAEVTVIIDEEMLIDWPFKVDLINVKVSLYVMDIAGLEILNVDPSTGLKIGENIEYL